jgi:integrase
MKHLIDAYLEDHESAWAYSTLKGEKSRLKAIADQLDKGPKALYAYLVSIKMKPYTIKTVFIRVSSLEAWAKLPPTYREWMKKHRNKFKHAYQKQELEITYEEALAKIAAITHTPTRRHALALLKTGLRISESYCVLEGKVIGKGGKPRKVFGTIEVTVPKSTLQLALSKVGLKAHDLRKLCATRLAEKGATASDLMKVFGWNDFKTAHIYLQGKDEQRLQSLMEESKEE